MRLFMQLVFYAVYTPTAGQNRFWLLCNEDINKCVLLRSAFEEARGKIVSIRYSISDACIADSFKRTSVKVLQFLVQRLIGNISQ